MNIEIQHSGVESALLRVDVVYTIIEVVMLLVLEIDTHPNIRTYCEKHLENNIKIAATKLERSEAELQKLTSQKPKQAFKTNHSYLTGLKISEVRIRRNNLYNWQKDWHCTKQGLAPVPNLIERIEPLQPQRSNNHPKQLLHYQNQIHIENLS